MQTALLPFLISQSPGVSPLYPTYSCPRDACVSAPTGSGKTLAYVLPIIEVSRSVLDLRQSLLWNKVLSSRIVTRLRALVVLPTRDLVTQVRETFETIGKGRGLKVLSSVIYMKYPYSQPRLGWNCDWPALLCPRAKPARWGALNSVSASFRGTLFS